MQLYGLFAFGCINWGLTLAAINITVFKNPSTIFINNPFSLECKVFSTSFVDKITWTKGGELNAQCQNNCRPVLIHDIKNSTFSDSGNYTCTASYGSMTKSSTIDVFIEKPINVSVFKNPSVTFINEPFSLECKVSGPSKIDNITWTKGKNVISKCQYNCKSMLIHDIKNSTFSDSGNYKCTASYSTMTKSSTIDVFIEKPINVTVVKNPSVTFINEPFSLVCKVSGPSRIVFITWIKGSTIISQCHCTNLFIKISNLSDSGNYTCVASYASMTKSSTIDVFIEKPINVKVFKNPSVTFINELFSLVCKVSDTSRIDNITWTKGKNIISQCQYNCTSLFIHDIKNSTLSDSGNYKCTASYASMTKSSTIDVFIEKPINITVFKNTSITFINEPFRLECKVSGPSKIDNITWTKGRKVILQCQYNCTSVLIHDIKNSTLSDSGSYTCTASYASMKKSSTIPAFVRKPLGIMILNNLTSLFVNESLILLCEVSSSFVISNITWITKSNAIMSQCHNNCSSSLSLYIQYSQLSDSGKYSCIASDPTMTKTVTVDINVEKRIKFYILWVYTTKTQFTIFCKMDTIPAETIWYQDNKLVATCNNNCSKELVYTSNQIQSNFQCVARTNKLLNKSPRITPPSIEMHVDVGGNLVKQISVICNIRYLIPQKIMIRRDIKVIKACYPATNTSLCSFNNFNVTYTTNERMATTRPNFLCEVNVGDYLTTISRPFPFTYAEITITPTKLHSLKLHSKFEIKCQGYANRSIKLEWQTNNNKVLSCDNKICTINEKNIKRNGVYSCYIKEIFGTNQTKIAVQRIDLQVVNTVLSLPKKYDAIFGEPVTLKCDIRSTHKIVHFAWYKEHNLLMDRNCIEEQCSDLSIFKPSENLDFQYKAVFPLTMGKKQEIQKGYYTCVASTRTFKMINKTYEKTYVIVNKIDLTFFMEQPYLQRNIPAVLMCWYSKCIENMTIILMKDRRNALITRIIKNCQINKFIMYTIKSPGRKDEGNYRCQVQLPFTSKVAYLKVGFPEKRLTINVTKDFLVTVGTPVRIQCKISNFFWQKSDILQWNYRVKFRTYAMCNATTCKNDELFLNLPNTTVDMSGSYTCYLKEKNAREPYLYDSFNLHVISHQIDVTPKRLHISAGESIRAFCHAVCSRDVIGVYWYHEDKIIMECDIHDINCTLDLNNVKMYMHGHYFCKIHVTDGKILSSDPVNVDIRSNLMSNFSVHTVSTKTILLLVLSMTLVLTWVIILFTRKRIVQLNNRRNHFDLSSASQTNNDSTKNSEKLPKTTQME